MTTQAPSRGLSYVGGDGKLHLSLHDGQARVWDSERRFVFMIAGTQGGKTSFGPFWLWREIQRRGPGDYLAVTATFPLLKLKMLPEFLRLFHDLLHLGTYYASDRLFLFNDGQTRVIFGSASNSDSLESATAKAAWLDECGQVEFRLDSWQAVQRRLAMYEGRVLGTTTPYNMGWLKGEIYDRWRDGDQDYDVIQFSSVENPAFPVAEFERAERTLPGWKFDLFFKGLLVRPAGLIYEDFINEYREQGGHEVHPFELTASWPRYTGIDFGAVNTALVWLAHDPEADVYYLYDETLSGGKTTRDHAAEALAKVHGINHVAWYGGSKSENQQRWDWSAEGVPIQEPTIGDEESGVGRGIRLFKGKSL